MNDCYSVANDYIFVVSGSGWEMLQGIIVHRAGADDVSVLEAGPARAVEVLLLAAAAAAATAVEDCEVAQLVVVEAFASVLDVVQTITVPIKVNWLMNIL